MFKKVKSQSEAADKAGFIVAKECEVICLDIKKHFQTEARAETSLPTGHVSLPPIYKISLFNECAWFCSEFFIMTWKMLNSYFCMNDF